MGLDYLNKKTWHSASIKNIAKVWEREQKELRKYQKQDEYNKKLLEEQHAHDLKKAQVEAGLIPRSALEKMDWMYNPVIGQQQNTEQYLLGKPVDLKDVNKNNLQDPQDNSNKYQAIVTEDVTNKTCENFTLIHEDPLFKITQEELKMKEKLMNNPLDMIHLLADQMKSLKKKKKDKSQKESKKHKKDKKKNDKRKKERDNSPSRSNSTGKDKKKQRRRSYSSDSSDLSGRSRSRSRSSNRRRHHRSRSNENRNKKDKHSKRDFRSTEKRHSQNHSHSRSSSPSKKQHKSQRQNLSPLRQSRKRSRSRSISEESKMKQKMYEDYLQKKVGNILVRSDDGSLRPDFGLMKRKFRNNLKPEEKLKMTDAEKKEMIAEMQSNAKNIAAERLKEFAEDYEKEESELTIKDLHKKQHNPKFMSEINETIYGKNKDLNSLSEQINKSKMNFKRNIDEANTFTK